MTEELFYRVGLVHLKVVHHHNSLMTSALLPQLQNEWDEGVLVVCGSKSVGVKQSPVSADVAYHSDRRAPRIRQLHPHAILQPDPGWRLPYIEGGLVNVHDLYLRSMHD